ncbi:MAG: hypothetical protein MR727_03495 [Lentisphaeria bacterium]|nr:hypothetical protein [Lentisphaeria bacterium]
MKTYFLPAFFFALSLHAANLLPDPEFDKSIRNSMIDCVPNTFRITHFTEPRTWNKTMRLDFLKPEKKEGKPDSCAVCVLWGSDKNGGVPVKPNTFYRYSLECKGKLPPGSSFVHIIEWSTDKKWEGHRRVPLNDGMAIDKFDVTPDEFIVKKGTFRTGPAAKRAALAVNVRGNAKDGNLPSPGDYLLVDKILLEELPPAVPQYVQNGKNVQTQPVRLLGCGESPQKDFTGLRSRQNAGASTSVAVKTVDEAFQITVSGNHSSRKSFQSGDRMEIIFDPTLRQQEIHHFSIAFDGTRMRKGIPVSPTDKRWDAEVLPGNGDTVWQARFTIPFSLLGLTKSSVRSGILLGFNAANYRNQGLRYFTWNPIDRDFHNPALFGRILTGDGYFQKEISRLQKAAAQNPDAAQFRKQTENVLRLAGNQEKFNELRRLEEKLYRSLSGNQVFSLTECLPTHSPEIPVRPDFQERKDAFSVTAAGNEIRPFTLLLSNHTGRFEEYRVSVFHPEAAGSECPGLKSADGKIFPAEQIHILRGVQVKDGEGKQHGLRFDPLVPASAGIFSVPANDSGLIWINFNTAGVPPERYSGMVRVVPLGEELTQVNADRLSYIGKWREFPLTVEVLDFKLPAEPVIPINMFNRACGKEMFRTMAELGIRDFHFRPWNFQMAFNDDGSLRSFDDSRAVKSMAELRSWAEECGIAGKMRFSVAYSLYPRFKNLWGMNRFKENTPEWERGWAECVRSLADSFRKLNVKPEKYMVEIWDEPPPSNFDELYKALCIARKSAPEMRLMATFDSRKLPLDKLRKLQDLLDVWIFWGKGYFTAPEYAAFIRELRQKGKEVGFYVCYTSMRQNLNEYFRLHGLWTWVHNLQVAAFYQLIDQPHNFNGISNWRQACQGGIMYMAGSQPVTSVRMECFRLGHTDIKYFALLESLLKKHPAHPAAAEAKKFLGEELRDTVYKHPYDKQRPEQQRTQCIELIKKFQNNTK